MTRNEKIKLAIEARQAYLDAKKKYHPEYEQ